MLYRKPLLLYYITFYINVYFSATITLHILYGNVVSCLYIILAISLYIVHRLINHCYYTILCSTLMFAFQRQSTNHISYSNIVSYIKLAIYIIHHLILYYIMFYVNVYSYILYANFVSYPYVICPITLYYQHYISFVQ